MGEIKNYPKENKSEITLTKIEINTFEDIKILEQIKFNFLIS